MYRPITFPSCGPRLGRRGASDQLNGAAPVFCLEKKRGRQKVRQIAEVIAVVQKRGGNGL